MNVLLRAGLSQVSDRPATARERDSRPVAARFRLLARVAILACLLTTGPAAAHDGKSSYTPHPPDLDTYRSSVVVLHFWATWCRPCLEEIPALAEFYRGHFETLKNRGMVLLTVSNDLRSKDLRQFLADRDLPFPIYFDPYEKLNDRLEVFALPTTLVIDREGEIVEYLAGPQHWNSPEMAAMLRRYLEPEQPLRRSSSQ